jgi:hypothetical protein
LTKCDDARSSGMQDISHSGKINITSNSFYGNVKKKKKSYYTNARPETLSYHAHSSLPLPGYTPEIYPGKNVSNLEISLFAARNIFRILFPV